MAQIGLHGLVGVSMGSGVFKKKDLFYGFVLGNLLPDTDFFLLAIVYLFDTALGTAMHRSFSHSLLAIIVFSLAAYLIARGSKERRTNLSLGIALGMLTHIIFDILFWFSGVALFWPLRLFGIPDTINIWASVTIPGLVTNLLGALDYFFAGLYLLFLVKTAADSPLVRRLKKLAFIQWPLFILYTVLSFFLSKGLFDLAHYVVFILFLLPTLLYATIKMRPVIEHLPECINGPHKMETT